MEKLAAGGEQRIRSVEQRIRSADDPEFQLGQVVEYWSSRYNKWVQEKNNQPIQVLQKSKTKRRGKTVIQYKLSIKPGTWVARIGDGGEERIRAVAAAKTRVAAKSEKSQPKPPQ